MFHNVTYKMVYEIILEATSNLSLCFSHHVPFVLLWPKRTYIFCTVIWGSCEHPSPLSNVSKC